MMRNAVAALLATAVVSGVPLAFVYPEVMATIGLIGIAVITWGMLFVLFGGGVKHD